MKHMGASHVREKNHGACSALQCANQHNALVLCSHALLVGLLHFVTTWGRGMDEGWRCVDTKEGVACKCEAGLVKGAVVSLKHLLADAVTAVLCPL